MKAFNSKFRVLILLFVVSQIVFRAFAEQVVDSTQIRYIKFSTTVNAITTRIALNEIKAFVDGENVAHGKVVSVNSKNSDYTDYETAVTDGNINSGWSSETYSNLTNNQSGPTINHPHWITVDLGTTYNVESLVLDINGGGSWAFNYTFDLQVSDDASNWSLVAHEDNTRGVLTYTNIPIQNVRYIKYLCYFSSDNGQVNVEEIQAISNGVNVAQNKSVTVSSGYSGSSAVDGNSSTRWSSNRSDHITDTRAEIGGVWAIVDLESVCTVDSLALTYNNNTQFTLSASADGINWIQIDQRQNDSNNYLYILNRLPKIRSKIVSYGNSTATCKVEIKSDGGSAVTERGICWSTSENPTISDNKVSSGEGIEDFTETVTDLVVNTIYYIRAYATNATGTKYSNVQKILFGLQIQTDVISDITKTSAISGGYVFAVSGVDVTEKGVCWSTTTQPTVLNDHTSEGSVKGDFSSTINNFTPNLRYYVRAYATTSSDTIYGEEYSFIYFDSKYLAKDGFFSDHIFSQSGTLNEQPYYQSQYGSSLYNEDGVWYLDGWVSSEDSGNPPLTGWWDGTTLELIETTLPKVTCNKNNIEESTQNDGTFSETITVTHDNTNNATFTGVDNEDFVETEKAIVRNLPAGLTAKIIRENSLLLTISLIGNATEHAEINNVSNVKIMFTPDAFTDGNTVNTIGNSMNISLNFFDNQTVTSNQTHFDESIMPIAFIKKSTLYIKNLTRHSDVWLYNVSGSILFHKNVSDSDMYEIPLNSAGMYLLKVNSDKGSWNFKLKKN